MLPLTNYITIGEYQLNIIVRNIETLIINDVDYIIISVCEDLFKTRNEHMEIFEKRKEFLHENE